MISILIALGLNLGLNINQPRFEATAEDHFAAQGAKYAGFDVWYDETNGLPTSAVGILPSQPDDFACFGDSIPFDTDGVKGCTTPTPAP